MSKTFIVVKDGVVTQCIAVNSIDDLVEIYSDCIIIEQTGSETIGWTYDGLSFTAPIGV